MRKSVFQFAALIGMASILWGNAIAQQPAFKALIVISKAKDHTSMMTCAQPFLDKIAAENHFVVDFTDDTSRINTANLRQYKVFVMLQLAPFDMSPSQQEAMKTFVEQDNGWVGIHAAGLTGKQFVKPTRTYWQWFEDFMGGIVYSPHPKFQKGTVVIEDRTHPITKNLPEKFEISDEWYEFDKSPRPNVHVLALADESTYQQNKPMGDHPIIWTNESYERMVYIGIGHDASLCSDKNFEMLVRNAILWAAGGK
jgi:type 1 glutamine amidotransferase